MRGINKVVLSGHITGRGDYDEKKGQLRCSFQVASDRHSHGDVITAVIRVNVFIDALARMCERKLTKDLYVIVEGELMNRGGQHEKLTEVRARQIIFVD